MATHKVHGQPDMLCFWRPKDKFAHFGQWYMSDFIVGGTSFVCAEQYMMWSKAQLFSDRAAASAILATHNPARMKRLGQTVANFNQKAWDAAKLGIVVQGSVAKFSCNVDLRALIVATGSKTLVEASPIDRIWGVGLKFDDPRVAHRSEWRGQNLLGEALMQARAIIVAQDASSA